jgi:hypothetical protein
VVHRRACSEIPKPSQEPANEALPTTISTCLRTTQAVHPQQTVQDMDSESPSPAPAPRTRCWTGCPALPLRRIELDVLLEPEASDARPYRDANGALPQSDERCGGWWRWVGSGRGPHGDMGLRR